MGANAHNDYADRKNGRKPVVPIHPELAEPLAEILGETYGLIVYQEQVMAIAQKVAGYSLGQADLLRRAMGKKKKEILDKEYVPFSAGMQERGYSDERDQDAVGHPRPVLRLRVQPRALRRLRPGLLLDGVPQGQLPGRVHGRAAHLGQATTRTSPRSTSHECRRMGIKVLPPDVNESDANFTPVGTDIRFGLSAIRNVGENVVASIIATRTAKGAYADFPDFLRKVEPVACNKKVIESLIKAGAFDSLGHTRQGLLRVHADAIDACMDTKRNEAVGQFDLFGADDDERRRRPEPKPFGLDLQIPLGGVGQGDAARLRAGDARPLRLRPPAVRHRARARRRGRLLDRRR